MILSNPLLDFAIGLTAFCLTVSLTVAALQEAIAQKFDMRAKDLREKIGDMLEGVAEGEETKRFFNHPLVAALNTRSADLGPSYIPRDVFTKVVKDLYLAGQAGVAVIDTARNLEENGNQIQRSLRTLAQQTKNDLAAFDTAIGDWFDGTMDRLSGLYKRNVRWILFWLGLAVAIAGNLDTLKVGVFLANNPTSRESTASAVRERMKTFPDGKEPDAASWKKFREDVDGLLAKSAVPMGWDKEQLARVVSIVTESDASAGQNADRLGAIGFLFLSVVGWLLTALAVTVGATFWFDALKRFVNIRATGPARKPTG